MIPIVLNQNKEQIKLVNVRKLKFKRGGREHCETLPWYSDDGKEWYVEEKLIEDHIKGG